jgi:general stress protein YciG
MINIDFTDKKFYTNISFATVNDLANGSGSTTDKSKEETNTNSNGNSRKGFASMSLQKRMDIAKRGGEARKKAAEAGNAPSYSQIGQKGGKASTKRK